MEIKNYKHKSKEYLYKKKFIYKVHFSSFGNFSKIQFIRV